MFEAAGVVEREAVTHSPAAIMAGETEAGKAERFHRLHHRGGHGALGIGRVVVLRLRHRRPAVAGQVGDHEREMRSERRRHAVPHDIALRMAVQEQERRPAAADAGENLSDRRVDPVRGVAGIKVGEVGHYDPQSMPAKAATPAQCRS